MKTIEKLDKICLIIENIILNFKEIEDAYETKCMASKNPYSVQECLHVKEKEKEIVILEAAIEIVRVIGEKNDI